MISPQDFTRLLQEQGFDFFTGVPDSLLKELCGYISDSFPSHNHSITPNEGSAIALASGYHLATGKAAMVYLQNSGTGNTINPLLSLADPEVYSIPMLLVIGWRSEPGVQDEPQHVKQGRVQESMLKALEYPYAILSRDLNVAQEQVKNLITSMKKTSGPVVLLVRKSTFSEYKSEASETVSLELSREEALTRILDTMDPDSRVVSTTGMISREVYEYRDRLGMDHARDFLTVGSMGHSVMIALGLATFHNRKIYCLDGDGAALMHLGNLALAAQQSPPTFVHIVLNNGAHDSVGGQPTLGFDLPLSEIAQSMGYLWSKTVRTGEELTKALAEINVSSTRCFLEVLVKKGARKDLGRPKTSPQENKLSFMNSLGVFYDPI